MLNTEKLKKVINERGISITRLASSIGISRESLYNKMNGSTEFKVSEITKMTEVLYLSRDTRDDIFFSYDSELYSLKENN